MTFGRHLDCTITTAPEPSCTPDNHTLRAASWLLGSWLGNRMTGHWMLWSARGSVRRWSDVDKRISRKRSTVSIKGRNRLEPLESKPAAKECVELKRRKCPGDEGYWRDEESDDGLKRQTGAKGKGREREEGEVRHGLKISHSRPPLEFGGPRDQRPGRQGGSAPRPQSPCDLPALHGMPGLLFPEPAHQPHNPGLWLADPWCDMAWGID